MEGEKMKTYLNKLIQIWCVAFFIICMGYDVYAAEPNWVRMDVNWHAIGNSRIKGIYFDKQKPPVLYEDAKLQKQPDITEKRILSNNQRLSALSLLSNQVTVRVINSPPIDGYVPWAVTSVTDKRSDEFELDAVPQSTVVGQYPPRINPKTDYIIGTFDTGASTSIIGYADALKAGLYNNVNKFITSNTTTVGGVFESVDAWVSQPLGLFIDGIGAIDSNGLLNDKSGMRGESNVSILVGPYPYDNSNLPTVIGTPFSVFYTTLIKNDIPVTITYNNKQYTGPDIRIFEKDDPQIPGYSNLIPMELRPGGAIGVQYTPTLDIFSFDSSPMSPSVIIGNSSQSLFFFSSVDLYNGNKQAIDKNRFILDTGAQVTVIGKRMAARLAIDIAHPDFVVEIQDVTGTDVNVPGFYLDAIEIPALGEWLSFTNVPVILLDVSSPEGGTLDGILGTNLFTEFNLVLRGGGLMLEGDPSLEFEFIPATLPGDIAPEGGDGVVDFLDYSVFAQAWQSTPASPNWNPKADVYPPSRPDEIINIYDLAQFLYYWLDNAN
jgi:hypothetical protein